MEILVNLISSSTESLPCLHLLRFSIALIKASEKGYVNIVKMLVDANAVINIHSNDGCCALIRSANYGHEDVVRLLIAQPKTNVDIRSKSGNTGEKRKTSFYVYPQSISLKIIVPFFSST